MKSETALCRRIERLEGVAVPSLSIACILRREGQPVAQAVENWEAENGALGGRQPWLVNLVTPSGGQAHA